MVLELQILPPALNVHLLHKARPTNDLLLSFRNLNHLYSKCYFARNPLLSSILSQISTMLPDSAIILLVHRSRSQQLKVYVHPNELSGLSYHSSPVTTHVILIASKNLNYEAFHTMKTNVRQSYVQKFRHRTK